MKYMLTVMALLFGFSSANAAQIQLTKSNTLTLNDAVTPESVSVLMESARLLDSEAPSSEPIYLVMNTPGGSIQDGLELIDSLNSLNRPVHTITIFAASMGFQIAQNLGDRFIIKSGTLMSHKASAGGLSGEFGDGNSQLDKRYSLWMKKILEMDNQTVLRTKGKQTLKSYREAYENELWLSAGEAVSGGYADSVVSVRCDLSLSGAREEKVVFMGMTFLIKFSMCPTNTNILSVDIEVPTSKGTMSYSDFKNKGGVFAASDVFVDNSVPVSRMGIDEKNIPTYIQKLKKHIVDNKTKVIKTVFYE